MNRVSINRTWATRVRECTGPSALDLGGRLPILVAVRGALLPELISGGVHVGTLSEVRRHE